MTPERAAELAQSHAAKRLANAIGRVNQRANAYTSPGFNPPLLDTDPDPDSDTTCWRFADGRLCWRVGTTVYRITGSTSGSDTSTVTLPADLPPQRFRSEYAATWGVSYCPNHGLESGGTLGYGATPEHGNRKIMLGFNAATIAADLDGATVREVTLEFSNASAVADPITIQLGVHLSTSAPTMFEGTRRNVSEEDWPAVGYGDTHQLSTFIGNSFADGTIKGLTIDQPEGAQFTGTMRWDTALLTVGYTK